MPPESRLRPAARHRRRRATGCRCAARREPRRSAQGRRRRGGRGATLNLGKRGVKGTVSLPGTGLSYQHRFEQSGSAGSRVACKRLKSSQSLYVWREINVLDHHKLALVAVSGKMLEEEVFE